MKKAIKDINEISFFFSSRRRHTRFDCDWSSDVCSSDLHQYPRLELRYSADLQRTARPAWVSRDKGFRWYCSCRSGSQMLARRVRPIPLVGEIGRESCREKGWISVVGGSLKKKKVGDNGV